VDTSDVLSAKSPVGYVKVARYTCRKNLVRLSQTIDPNMPTAPIGKRMRSNGSRERCTLGGGAPLKLSNQSEEQPKGCPEYEMSSEAGGVRRAQIQKIPITQSRL